MEKLNIKISKEIAEEFKSELEIASKQIEELKQYADLFSSRELGLDYFEEKMVKKVEHVSYILGWIMRSSQEIVDKQKKFLSNKEWFGLNEDSND